MNHDALTDLGFTAAERELLEHAWNSGLLDFLLNEDANFMRRHDATLAATLDWPHHGVDLADATVFGVAGFTPQQTRLIWSAPQPADEGEALWCRWVDGEELLELDLPPDFLAYVFAASDSVEQVLDWKTMHQRATRGDPQPDGEVRTTDEVLDAARFMAEMQHPANNRCHNRNATPSNTLD